MIPEYPIANVQCQYDSPSDTEADERAVDGGGDHTYGRLESTDEPPAFLIQQVKAVTLAGETKQREYIQVKLHSSISKTLL